MLPSPALFDFDATTSLLHDSNVRAAVICWAMVLSAFFILRIPREVLFGCLILAGATVGLAVTVVDLAPEPAAASSRTSEMTGVRAQTAPPVRGPSVQRVERTQPY